MFSLRNRFLQRSVSAFVRIQPRGQTQNACVYHPSRNAANRFTPFGRLQRAARSQSTLGPAAMRARYHILFFDVVSPQSNPARCERIDTNTQSHDRLSRCRSSTPERGDAVYLTVRCFVLWRERRKIKKNKNTRPRIGLSASWRRRTYARVEFSRT